MKILSFLAICYCLLFILSIMSGNYVLTAITGLFGVGLVIAVTIVLEIISESVARVHNETRMEIEKIHEALKKLAPTTNQTTADSDTLKD